MNSNNNILFLGISVFLCVSGSAFAEDVYLGETIDSSLHSLRQSAQHAAKQNDRFYEKNEDLMEKISFLEMKIASMNEQRHELFSDQPDEAIEIEKEIQRVQSYEAGVRVSVDQIDQANNEQSRLFQNLDIKERQKEEIREDVISTRAQIAKVLKQKDQLKRDSIAVPQSKKKRQLVRMINEADVEIGELQSKLKDYEGLGLSQVRSVKQLEAENQELVREIKLLLKQIKNLEEQEHRAQQGLSQVIHDNDGQLKTLSKDIKQLEQRRGELEAIFDQAREKIQKQKLDLVSVDAKESDIEENVNIIRSENVALKKEIKSLQRILKEIEG